MQLVYGFAIKDNNKLTFPNFSMRGPQSAWVASQGTPFKCAECIFSLSFMIQYFCRLLFCVFLVIWRNQFYLTCRLPSFKSHFIMLKSYFCTFFLIFPFIFWAPPWVAPPLRKPFPCSMLCYLDKDAKMIVALKAKGIISGVTKNHKDLVWLCSLWDLLHSYSYCWHHINLVIFG